MIAAAAVLVGARILNSTDPGGGGGGPVPPTGDTQLIAQIDATTALLVTVLDEKLTALSLARATGDRAALDLRASEVQFVRQAIWQLARSRKLAERL